MSQPAKSQKTHPKVEPPKLPDGFLIDKADPAIIVASLTEHLKLGEEKVGATPIEQGVILLDAHFKKTYSAEGELAKCDKCGGIGPASEEIAPVCCYCGDSEGVETSEEEEVVEEEDNAEGEEVPEAEPTEDADSDLATMGEPEPKKSEPAKGTDGKSTALAKKAVTVEDLVPAGVTEAELQKEVAVFIRLKGEGAGAMYDVGDQARLIFEKQLWKAQTVTSTAEDGTVKVALKYRSFDAFCKEVLGFTASHCYKLMDTTVAYTREQVVKYSMTNIGLVLSLPPEAQSALLEAAKTHKWGRRVLAQKVLEEKAKNPDAGKRETGRAKTPDGKGGGRAGKLTKKQKETITIATIAGRTYVLPCFILPKKGEKPSERATEVTDQVPVFFVELDNKVQLTGKIEKDKDGNIQIKLLFKPI